MKNGDKLIARWDEKNAWNTHMKAKEPVHYWFYDGAQVRRALQAALGLKDSRGILFGGLCAEPDEVAAKSASILAEEKFYRARLMPCRHDIELTVKIESIHCPECPAGDPARTVGFIYRDSRRYREPTSIPLADPGLTAPAVPPGSYS
jgi:hypothetical protein